MCCKDGQIIDSSPETDSRKMCSYFSFTHVYTNAGGKLSGVNEMCVDSKVVSNKRFAFNEY
jgi:hypothetical protein